MPLLVVVLLLGVVEGVTEFLPVSSTGHLILAARLLPSLGTDRAELFDVVIQSGAMLAVIGLYRARLVAVLRPAPSPAAFGGRRGFVAIGLGVAPALLAGYLLRREVHELRTPAVVAAALAAGGVAILLLERLRGDRGTRSLDAITPTIALGVGLFQCLALVPGVSRSAATICGGMLLGLSRDAATEWSFLLGVPILFAASAYEVVAHRELLTSGTLGLVAVGFVVAAASAALAVRAFTAYVARSGLSAFGVYRLALAAVVVALL